MTTAQSYTKGKEKILAFAVVEFERSPCSELRREARGAENQQARFPGMMLIKPGDLP